MTDFRYTHKIRPYNSWWKGEIEGSEEEKMKDATTIKEYTYKLLDYAERKESPAEEVAAHRRLYAFDRQGPRSWCQRLNIKGKLTSAEVIYLLTTNMSSIRLSKILEVDSRKIRAIRAGEYPCWEWEYQLIKRIKSIVANDYKDNKDSIKEVFVLYKVNSPTDREELYTFSSKRKAVKARKDIISKKRYEEMTKDKTLDILYPIEPKPLL
jgi:hypothetical protein